MDKYLVSLAFLLLFAEAGWLYYDMQNPTGSSTQSSVDDKPLGKILKSRSQVRKKAQDSLIWEETKTEQNLFAYDSVLTMTQSTAEISLQGDSRISMNENTLVVIEPPRNNEVDGPLRLRFKKGNLQARSGRTPQSVTTDEYVVEASKDTKMNIRSTPDDKIQIDAIEGQVKILDPKSFTVAQVVSEGESARVDGTKEPKIVVEKTAQIDWSVPVDGQKVYSHTDQTNVRFAWKGKIDAIIIDNKKEIFTQEIHQEQSESVIPLPYGNYLVKLASGPQTTFGRQVSVWPAPKIYLVNPVVRSRFKKDVDIRFLWTQTEDVASYTLEIALDPEFTKIVRKVETPSMTFDLQIQAVGHYYWRVRGKDNAGFEIPELYSSDFYVLDKPLEAPKLKSPKIEIDQEKESHKKPKRFSFIKYLLNEFLPSAEANESTPLPRHYFAEFQWEPVEGAQGYVVEISETPDFRNLVLTKRVKSESFKWKNFKLGQYYWRVAGTDITDEQGLFSETAFADLKQIPAGPIRPVAPPPKPVVVAPPPQTPPPKPVVVEKKPEPPKEYPHEKWKFKIEGGGHGTISLQRGVDFRSKLFGVGVWDGRLSIRPPEHSFSFWHTEVEFHLLSATGSPEAQFPFQPKISIAAFRVALIKEDSWGFVAGQFPLFKRSDLESLTYYNPLAGGAFKQWFAGGRRYRLTIVGGQTFLLEGSGQQTWDITNWLDVTAEARLQTGYSLNKDLWQDLTIYFWLGFNF